MPGVCRIAVCPPATSAGAAWRVIQSTIEKCPQRMLDPRRTAFSRRIVAGGDPANQLLALRSRLFNGDVWKPAKANFRRSAIDFFVQKQRQRIRRSQFRDKSRLPTIVNHPATVERCQQIRQRRLREVHFLGHFSFPCFVRAYLCATVEVKCRQFSGSARNQNFAGIPSLSIAVNIAKQWESPVPFSSKQGVAGSSPAGGTEHRR